MYRHGSEHSYSHTEEEDGCEFVSTRTIIDPPNTCPNTQACIQKHLPGAAAPPRSASSAPPASWPPRPPSAPQSTPSRHCAGWWGSCVFFCDVVIMVGGSVYVLGWGRDMNATTHNKDEDAPCLLGEEGERHGSTGPTEGARCGWWRLLIRRWRAYACEMGTCACGACEGSVIAPRPEACAFSPRRLNHALDWCGLHGSTHHLFTYPVLVRCGVVWINTTSFPPRSRFLDSGCSRRPRRRARLCVVLRLIQKRASEPVERIDCNSVKPSNSVEPSGTGITH